MLRRGLIAASFLASLALVSPAQAGGGQKGDFELGAFGGWTWFDNYGALEPNNYVLYGIHLGYFFTPSFSFEIAPQGVLTDSDVATVGDIRLTSVRGNLLYNFLPEKKFRPFVTMGLGWEELHVQAGGKSDDLGINAGLGFRYFLIPSFAIRADGRFVYTEVGGGVNDREYNYEATLGFSVLLGGKPPTDSDADGVSDKKDECPSTPAGAKVNEKGCPSDSDGDGIYDGIDQCADTAKGLKVDERGCSMDTDGDGVMDGPDQCADTPKGAQVDEKGCPIDKDGDGVADAADQCPDTPAGIKVDEKGCPMDSDADGVADDKDKCPETAQGTKVDAMGCPLVSKARGVLKGVTFKSSSTELTQGSYVALNAVAEALKEFPAVRVEVQGHTDKTGVEASNVKLSQARAQKVSDYLAAHGIDTTRLEVKGYGSSKPLASNKTKEGRAKNRRVELNWLD